MIHDGCAGQGGRPGHDGQDGVEGVIRALALWLKPHSKG